MVNCFKSEPKASFLFGDVVFVDQINAQNIIRFYSSDKFRSWKLRFGWMPPHTATFIKRSAYDQVGNCSIDYKIQLIEFWGHNT